MSPCATVQPVAPHLMPPAHMVIQSQTQSQPPTYLPHVQQLVPTLTQTAPSTPTPYASALALRVPYMVLQAADQPSNLELAGSSQISSARVQSAQSSAAFVPTTGNR